MEAVHDAKRLVELQALPLERKIQISQARIIEWYQHYNGNVVVSFSGGKDSTVLLHMVRKLYPNVRAVFSNTGLEYPEIQKFAKSFDLVDAVTPKMRFDQVISTYGYPIISKEVAEAIYYARRIRSQVVQVERERQAENAQKCTAQERQTDSRGASIPARPMKQAEWKRLEIGGGEEQAYPDKHSEKPQNGSQRENVRSRDSKWGDYHRRCLHPNRNNKRDEECFRNIRAGVVSEKSIFNKEKYLVLARDIPVPISHICCSKMKKLPMKAYQHKYGLYPILGTLAEESRVRKQGWIRHGCNAFQSKSPSSQPLSFWTEQDILAYIVKYSVEICSVYGDVCAVDGDGIEYNRETANFMLTWNLPCRLHCTGCDRTGCMFCLFGMHNEKGTTRFQRMAFTHPRQYEYSVGGGQWVDNPKYDPTAPKFDGEWQNWNPKKIWVPSKKGLGIGKVCDMVNEHYGKDFLRYE